MTSSSAPTSFSRTIPTRCAPAIATASADRPCGGKRASVRM
jgi:hypothetical protein